LSGRGWKHRRFGWAGVYGKKLPRVEPNRGVIKDDKKEQRRGRWGPNGATGGQERNRPFAGNKGKDRAIEREGKKKKEKRWGGGKKTWAMFVFDLTAKGGSIDGFNNKHE